MISASLRVARHRSEWRGELTGRRGRDLQPASRPAESRAWSAG